MKFLTNIEKYSLPGEKIVLNELGINYVVKDKAFDMQGKIVSGQIAIYVEDGVTQRQLNDWCDYHMFITKTYTDILINSGFCTRKELEERDVVIEFGCERKYFPERDISIIKEYLCKI